MRRAILVLMLLLLCSSAYGASMEMLQVGFSGSLSTNRILLEELTAGGKSIILGTSTGIFIFTGTYSVADIAKIFDQDIGAMPPSLEPVAYVPIEVSISLWLILAIALLALAVLDFERREVH